MIAGVLSPFKSSSPYIMLSLCRLCQRTCPHEILNCMPSIIVSYPLRIITSKISISKLNYIYKQIALTPSHKNRDGICNSSKPREEKKIIIYPPPKSWDPSAPSKIGIFITKYVKVNIINYMIILSQHNIMCKILKYCYLTRNTYNLGKEYFLKMVKVELK